MKKRLELNQNKELRKDIVECTAWIQKLLAAYLTWHPATRSGRGARAPPGCASEAVRLPNGGSTARSAGSGTAPAVAPVARPQRATRQPAMPMNCLKCQSPDHRLRQCPNARPDEIDGLIATWRASRPPAPMQQMKKVAVQRKPTQAEATTTGDTTADQGTTTAHIGGLTVTAALLDSGADASLVSAGVVDTLTRGGHFTSRCTVDPVLLAPLGGDPITVTRKIRFDEVALETPAGPLMLGGLKCWIHGEDSTLSLTIGRPVLVQLGYSTADLLSAAKSRRCEYRLDDATAYSPTSLVPNMPAATPLIRMHALLDAELNPCAPGDSVDEMVATPELTQFEPVDVRRVLLQKVQDAHEAGLPDTSCDQLKALLEKHLDVFRLSFGNDPPVKVEPLKVRLRPDARPVKAKARRLPPNLQAFVERHMNELVKSGLVRVNHRACWASPPRIVAKTEPGEYRMTVDTREPNKNVEGMPWPMPDLESDLGKVEGSSCYFTLDWFRGYWQLPLAEESQELYTIITHRGMYTPTRVLMGASDAVAYCQGVVKQIFGPLLFTEILAWLDDILGYAKTPSELLGVLEHVLTLCAEYGLKLHPSKCCFYTTEAKWCGKLISAGGVRHYPDRVACLRDMPSPRTAGDLQQFLCAVNWMRTSIPNYTALVADLHGILETAATVAKGRKKAQLHRVELARVDWGPPQEAAMKGVKDALLRMVPLAHPKADWSVCLFTDASDAHWGAVVTQIPPDDIGLPLEHQRHAPLAFLSGSFNGASSRWPIIDKEAFAIVAACKRLMYLLPRPGGFHIYTDHRNLQHIFAPEQANSTMPKFQADRLQRWAMTLTMFNYVIEHVSGERNVRGDLLSRWGAPSDGPQDQVSRVTRMSALMVTRRVSTPRDRFRVAISQRDSAHSARRSGSARQRE